MKKKPVFAAILATLSFVFVVSIEKTTASDCLPDPCDTACPAPCDITCPAPCDNACQPQAPGCYLYDKSIFESPIFENRLIGKKSKSKITFYGWMLTGITVNNHGATQTYEGSAYPFNNRPNRPGYTTSSGNTYVMQIEQPTDWKVNQLWLGAKKELDNHFGWGFQSDFIYGTDMRYARNWGDYSFDAKWGSGDYFAGFSQLFATVGTKDLFLKVGKFAGSFSHEGLAAPREYFYSHANIAYGRPLVTQGTMVEWHPNKKWMLTGGWLAGVFNSFENPYNDSAFLGKATYNFTEKVALSYRIFYNDKGQRPGSPITGQIDCLNGLIFTWKIDKNWFYMGEIATTNNKNYGGRNGNAWGINNHLIRTWSEKFSTGFRGEYHHSHNSTFDNAGVTNGEGGDIWTFTLAAHYKLTPKTTFRPELRYDYADYKNGYRPFGGDESKSDQLCGGVSFIVMF